MAMSVCFIERPNILNAEQCRCIVDTSLPQLGRSTVTGPARKVHPARTSWGCTLSDTAFPNLLLGGAQPFEYILQELIKMPIENREPWRVIRYEPGQEYKPHYDWFSPTTWPTMLAMGGQRIITVVIYLCDVSVGGTTNFPRLGRSFQAERGKLLAWNNSTPEGKPLLSTLHAGVPPVSNDKWVLSACYRQNPFTGSRPT
jgi:prolyl 4-hydroxylase